MKNSKSVGTQRNYAQKFKIFEAWCLHRNLISLPASELTVKLFLTDFATSKKSSSQLQQFVAALISFHKLNSLDSSHISYSPSIKLLIEGASRTFGKPTKRMALGGLELVNLLINNFLMGELNNVNVVSLDTWRTVTMCSLLFHSVSRFSCVKDLKISNIVFDDSHDFMTISFPNSKTDQRKKGTFSVVNASGGKFCPVT